MPDKGRIWKGADAIFVLWRGSEDDPLGSRFVGSHMDLTAHSGPVSRPKRPNGVLADLHQWFIKDRAQSGPSAA